MESEDRQTIDSKRHPGIILPDMNNRVRLLCWTPNGKQFLSYRTKLAFWQPTTRSLKHVPRLSRPILQAFRVPRSAPIRSA